MSNRKIMHVLYLHLAWSKIFGSLDEIPSVTKGSCKSKILNEF